MPEVVAREPERIAGDDLPGPRGRIGGVGGRGRTGGVGGRGRTGGIGHRAGCGGDRGDEDRRWRRGRPRRAEPAPGSSSSQDLDRIQPRSDEDRLDRPEPAPGSFSSQDLDRIQPRSDEDRLDRPEPAPRLILPSGPSTGFSRAPMRAGYRPDTTLDTKKSQRGGQEGDGPMELHAPTEGLLVDHQQVHL